MKAPPKLRLDSLLVERGIFASRQKAQRAILAGLVFVDGQRMDKPGSMLRHDVRLEATATERYVSRGGRKLEAALTYFGIQPAGWTCVDIGASTGGFTDCLLQHGAARVYAFDVGHGQLDWKIRSDSRVVVREKLNARNLVATDLPEPTRLGVIDVSFISLTMILKPLAEALAASGTEARAGRGIIVALIKPQFELVRAEIGQGGIVRDPGLHDKAIGRISTFVAEQMPQWHWTGIMDSPILGMEGNKEFLTCLRS